MDRKTLEAFAREAAKGLKTEKDLNELGGWETIQMVQKYAHLDAGHLSNYANVTEFTSHFRHTTDEENKIAA